ncbi:hypothetical protein GGR57DRAFT_88992 [Xylariaceae sp. FL1272]|nr:hypothetical protein GGR57DRAFT_88992 [Xylariaceae sp. FL1272]
MATSRENTTFRLRRCPVNTTAKTCEEWLSLAFIDVQAEEIKVLSLATNLDPWERPRTKVATLMFLTTPTLILEQEAENEWILPIDGLTEPLILDTHFLGLTPLNDVDDAAHEYDVIAISGLASHPFGSWQFKSGNRNFMWIRDALPRAMPEIRAILYGYDSRLLGSKSFQSIEDLATSFINHIKANGWHFATSKPLLFLAHSLGGIVLKASFSMMASGDDQGQSILSRFWGGIFFGVPSHGMTTSHLLTMVEGQVNEHMISDLATKSKYLEALDDQFSAIVLTRYMKLRWAYETKTSPTVKRHEDGSYSRSGPEEILVTKESATRRLHHLSTPATFPINENHSDMVKFQRDDRNLQIVLSKLRDVCGYGDSKWMELDLRENRNRPGHTFSRSPGKLNAYEMQSSQVNWFLNDQLRASIISDLLKSLEIPGRDSRLNSIDRNFSHTFEWIFDEDLPLAEWLKDESGMFWIHGKPASGKSTLMKFIFQSSRTWELLHKFSSEALQVKAAFFFYDRGVPMQRSFEGLLRSILHQIIDSSNRLAATLAQKLRNERGGRPIMSEDWSISELESSIHYLLQQDQVKLELFFVFDALDEYDGQPDFVCQILKEMMNVIDNSPNKLKILFSSRSWDTFHRQFKGVRSLQLQDHTKGDIREYCFGFVDAQGDDVSLVLSAITSTVIDRANGVFLWVKLVLHELIAEATKGKQAQELLTILNAIPDDLRDYYARIIERTPEKYRWEAYVIFQTLTNGRDVFALPDLLHIIACSQSSTYAEAQQQLAASERSLTTLTWKDRNTQHIAREKRPNQTLAKVLSRVSKAIKITKRPFESWNDKEQQKSKIMTMTGGLVEFTRAGLPRSETPDAAQLAHQTVREFVRDHEFKRRILGSQSRITFDNSHTFLSRHALANGDLIRSAPFLFLNEITTGNSLRQFIDSVPKDIFLRFDDQFTRFYPSWTSPKRMLDVSQGRGKAFATPIASPLAFAVFNNLRLYLEDSFQRNSNVFRNTKEKLLSISPNPYLVPMCTSSVELYRGHVAILQYLFTNGYTAKQDPEAFRTIIASLVEDLVYRNQNLGIDQEFLEAKATMLISHGQPADASIDVPNRQSRPSPARNCVQAIHIATSPDLIECIVEKGIDVNTPDRSGNRPLDHAFSYWDDVGSSCQKLAMIGPLNDTEFQRMYRRIACLVERGATTATTPSQVWNLCLANYETRGFDTDKIRSCFQQCFPNPRGI